MRKAFFRVAIDGRDMTTEWAPVVTKISVKDASGSEADTASVEFDDKGGQIPLPPKGTPISIALGWEGATGLVVFDGFTDEPFSSGARGQGMLLEITAKSADPRSGLKSEREKHVDDATFEDAATTFGGEAGVQVTVHPDLASIARDWWAMEGESFPSWGARIAREIGATFKIMGTRAVFSPRNSGEATSGGALPSITATRDVNLMAWRISPALSRPPAKTYRVRRYDPEQAKYVYVEVQAEIEDDEAASTDRQTVGDEATAQTRADAKKREGDRESGGGSVTIDGEPAAQAEGTLILVGTRPGIDGTYRIDSVQHDLTRGGGFTTSLELKQPSGGAGEDGRAVSPDGGSDTPADPSSSSWATPNGLAGDNLPADNLA